MGSPHQSFLNWTAQYLPAETERLELELLGADVAWSETQLFLIPLSRSTAAAVLAARNPRMVMRGLVRGGPGKLRRMRTLLAVLATAGPEPPSYNSWIRLFDRWPDPLVKRAVRENADRWPNVLILVHAARGSGSDAAQATIASLEQQIGGAGIRLIQRKTDVTGLLEDARQEYVGLLQAGEILPPHSIAVMREWAARHGSPAALFGDEDRFGKDGSRCDPLFKPLPNRLLMLSGTLTRGLWLFRRELVQRHADWQLAPFAEALRLDLWLRLDEVGDAGATARVPFVLTHRRPDAETVPPENLGQVVRAHLARKVQTALIDDSTMPLRVRPTLPAAARGLVTLIVPSACRTAHVTRCLQAVLAGTAYPDLALAIVVSQTGPLEVTQRGVLKELMDDGRVRVLMLPAEQFNYSRANNFGARHSAGPFVCLLNDDVAPMSADWLEAMLGHFADPEVGAVGAMLYYEDDTLQHGGVLLGLGGLAEHVSRFLPMSAPGYGHRAALSQEVSAATAACLLVRRTAFEQVGGLDETFPIAFNDVDFCLKLRTAGWRIVLCADAKLRHYKSLSLGHHFAGERAALERIEVQRMRQRWGAAVGGDPFHNPNLSLARGSEWRLAFPPRVRVDDILNPDPILHSASQRLDLVR